MDNKRVFHKPRPQGHHDDRSDRHDRHDRQDRHEQERKKNFSVSEHFKRDDFKCSCEDCQSEFKISLTLVGVLEHLYLKYDQKIEVLSAYRCASYATKRGGSVKKSYHNMGKAMDIRLKEGSNAELFNYINTLPEIKGIGYYPKGDYIHMDIRDKDKSVWVFEAGAYLDLTDSLRQRYKLG